MKTQIEKLTPETLLNYAINSGRPFEAYTSIKDRWGDWIPEVTYIGVELKKDVYYWWKIYKDDNHLFFDHRYNRVNGASQKSFRKAWDAEKIILKELNK